MPTDAPLPTPAPAHRTVRGAFRTTAELDRALARIAAARPPAVGVLVAADALAAHLLGGPGSEAPRALFVGLAGLAQDVAIGYRQAWQAIELVGGVPSTGGRLRDIAREIGADSDAQCVRFELPEAHLTALLDWADDVRERGGAAGAWVRPGMGRGWILVPGEAQADEALAWLGAQARGCGGRMTIAAAAAVGT